MKEHLTHVGAVLILFTTEDTEDAEVNLVHAGAEMNESFLSTIKLKKVLRQIWWYFFYCE